MSHPTDSSQLLVGHQWVIDAIARQIESASRAHAYLVTGPDHVGKFTTALEMARLFMCEHTPACGVCRNCRLLLKGGHPDLRVLEIPADRKSIPVKEVHEFLQGIALRPLEARVKVYVIRGAEDLSEEGANALLKTIEEPPSNVTLILTVASLSELLPTIVSRCQVINLHRATAAEIGDHLVSTHGVAPDRAEVIAQASQGRPGWAILATDKPELLDERHDRARDLLQLLGGDRLARIRYADDLAEEWSGHADDVREVLETWTEVWRDVLLVQQGLRERAAHAVGLSEIATTAGQLDARSVRTALKDTLDVVNSLDRNAHPRLALENYALRLPALPAGRHDR